MRVYKTSKGWAILIYITAPLIIALFCWVLTIPIYPTIEIDLQSYMFLLLPISLAMIALSVIGIIETAKSKFIIDNDKISTINTFSNKQLFFKEIKGYRILDQFVIIESNNKQKKKIKVSTYFEKVNEITEWLSENYQDLNTVEAKQEKEAILKNNEFGWTTEEREKKLNKAHKTAKILNWTGVLIGIATLFIAPPYEDTIIAAVLFPIICLIILKKSNGLIRIDDKQKSVYPTIFLSILAPSSGLCLKAVIGYNIFDYSKTLVPSLLITLIYIVALTSNNDEFKYKNINDYLSRLCLSIFIFCYSFGSVINLNCIYDKSEPEIFKTTILNKRISSNESTSYFLKLTPWGEQKEIDEVSVSKDLYNRLKKNDQVKIYFMNGQFGIPWFQVSE